MKLYTYILILAFSIHFFELVIITLNFKVNQQFYMEICENKDKPEMKCNGKCHLKKQIQQHEEEKSDKEKAMPQKENDNFLKKAVVHLSSPGTIELEYKSIYIPFLKNRIHLFDIFHPPQYQV